MLKTACTTGCLRKYLILLQATDFLGNMLPLFVGPPPTVNGLTGTVHVQLWNVSAHVSCVPLSASADNVSDMSGTQIIITHVCVLCCNLCWKSSATLKLLLMTVADM